MYKVIRFFIDKDSGEDYLVGDEYKTTSKERAKELIDLGRVREIKEVKKAKSKKDDAE